MSPQAGNVFHVRSSGIYKMQLQPIRYSRTQGASLVMRSRHPVLGATHRSAPMIHGLRPCSAIQSRPSAGQGVEAPSFGPTMLAFSIVASTLLGLDAGYARAHSGEASLEHQHRHAMSSSQLLIAPNPQADTADGVTSQAAAFRCTPVTASERVNAWGDLGGYKHRSATTSPQAEKLIDQGLVLAYNFNQFEAKKSFEAALTFDDKAPMAYFGLAYASGPFLNKPAGVPPADMSYPVFSEQEQLFGRQAIDTGLQLVTQQFEEAQRAVTVGKGDEDRLARLERDKAYLEALAPVFHAEQPYGDAYIEANAKYARSMEAWAAAHPDDVDAIALAAEAWTNEQPWDFWEASDNTQPRLHTLHILDLIQSALAQYPGHPLAAHMMVHVTEGSASGTAATALSAARDLGLVNPTMGHLVHMSSHTYLRTGQWHDGVEANLKALKLDEQHANRCIEPDMPFHNAGMGLYAALAGAEKEAAMKLAADLATYPRVYGPMYMTDGRDRLGPPLAHLRFADWAALSDFKAADVDPTQDGLMMLPPGAKEFADVEIHYLGAMTAAAESAGAKDKEAAAAWLAKSGTELQLLHEAIARQPEDPITLPGTGLGIYSPGYKAVAQHDEQVAKARLAVLKGDWQSATQLLSNAAAAESSYGYVEPPRFSQPQGECLGWVLYKQGRWEEAAQAYTQVLTEYPRTPWALTGLRDVYDAMQHGNSPEKLSAGVPSRADVLKMLKDVQTESKGAAIQLPSSCPAFSEPASL